MDEFLPQGDMMLAQDELNLGVAGSLDDMRQSADDANLIANAELKAGCLDAARASYLRVIQTYVGAAFEAERQIAQIGVEDVREAQHAQRGTPSAPPASTPTTPPKKGG